MLGALRTLRVLRLLVARWLHRVGALMFALYLALPAVGNLVVLLGFWVLAFAIVGLSLFQGAEIGDWYPDGEGLGDKLNFSTLASAIATLGVLLRLEGWTTLWADLVRAPYPAGDKPPEWLASAYFAIFIISSVYAMLSVFIALLLDSLETLNAAVGNKVDPRDISRLGRRWADLDPEGDQMLPADRLGVLLRRLGQPFVERHEVSSLQRLSALLVTLDLAVYSNDDSADMSRLLLPPDAEVAYAEVAYALAQRAVFGAQPERYALQPALQRQVLSHIPKAFPILRELPAKRTFTSELSVARAIARKAFDPSHLASAGQVGSDTDTDGSDSDDPFSEEMQTDEGFGLRKKSAPSGNGGSFRYIAV